MRVQRRDALTLRSCRTMHELPRSVNGSSGSGITWVSFFKGWQDRLSALGDKSRDTAQFVHGQIEIACDNRHASDRLTAHTNAWAFFRRHECHRPPLIRERSTSVPLLKVAPARPVRER